MRQTVFGLNKILTPLVFSVLFSVIIFAVISSILYSQSRSQLRTDIERPQSYLLAVDVELLGVKAVLGSIGAPSCSATLLSDLRRFEYQLQYFSDIAILDGDIIECSTTLGGAGVGAVVEGQIYPLGDEADGEPTFLIASPSLHTDSGTPGLYLRSGSYLLTVNDRLLLTETSSETLITFAMPTDAGFVPLLGEVGPGPVGSVVDLDRGIFSEILCDTGVGLCIHGTRVIQDLQTIIWIVIGASLIVGFILGFASTWLVGRYVNAQSSLKAKLLRAIENQELFVVYQPIVRARTGALVGAEALVRWVDSDNAFVSPDIFCALAEAAGFSDKITDYVMRYTAEHIWDRPEGKGTMIAFNVAPSEILADNFVSRYSGLLKELGVNQSAAKFEITERMQVDMNAFELAVDKIASAGFKLSLDDFGTGQSSFPYLKRLPLDTIKIDRTFVNALGEDNAFGRMLPHMVDMLMALGCEVVVEGVETESQCSWFAERGDVLAQGYYFSRPMHSGDFLTLLKNSTAETSGDLLLHATERAQ